MIWISWVETNDGVEWENKDDGGGQITRSLQHKPVILKVGRENTNNSCCDMILHSTQVDGFILSFLPKQIFIVELEWKEENVRRRSQYIINENCKLTSHRRHLWNKII